MVDHKKQLVLEIQINRELDAVGWKSVASIGSRKAEQAHRKLATYFTIEALFHEIWPTEIQSIILGFGDAISPLKWLFVISFISFRPANIYSWFGRRRS